MNHDPVHAGAFGKGEHLNVVVETPAGSRTKYKWDPDARAYRASRVLPLGMAFPFDFGFVPRTQADDGDPLDALVLADAPLAIGALVECRVLGAYRVKTSDSPGGTLVRNDRLVVVPAFALRGAIWRTINDVGEPLLHEIGAFFATYTELQGRSFELIGVVDRAEALRLVERAAR